MSMEPERKKRKLDLGTVVEDGEENQLVSTLTETHKPMEERQHLSQGANTDDSMMWPSPLPESGLQTALPGRSILRPTRSSHATMPLDSSIESMSAASAIGIHQPGAESSSPTSNIASNTTKNPTSDDEDNITMDGVHSSIELVKYTGRMAVISLEERGDRYKQRLHASKKQVTDLRLELSESSRELKEARMMIKSLEKDKAKAEHSWSVYKGQYKKMLSEMKVDKNQIAYLEALLAFEERSGYSSMLSELQLE